MISFMVKDHGSAPGRGHNDDCWGASQTAVWILDGATGLGKERLLSTAASDAQWFAKAVDFELTAADWNQPTEQLLSSVMRNVNARFRAEAAGFANRVALWPSASFSMVRLLSDQIEFSNLGDCRVLWKRADYDEISSFGWSRVTRLDRQVVAEIMRMHSAGRTDSDEIWQAISPMIQANRQLKNRAGGYWILDLLGEGIPYLQTMRIEASDVECILMCTDGYYRAVDTYQLQTDCSLLEQSAKVGVNQIIDMIRLFDRNDERCLKNPRIKASDDATCVLLGLTPEKRTRLRGD